MNIQLFKTFLKQSLEKFLIYRTTSLLVVLFTIMFSIIQIITTIVYYSYTNNIAGFQLYDFFMLIATFDLISSIYNIFCINSHESLSDKIIEGELDFDLIRPIDSQIINNFCEFEISSIISAIVPILLILYSLPKILDVTGKGIVFYILFVILGAYFYYLLNQIFVSFTFWVDRPGKLLGIPEDLFEIGSKPLRIFPKFIQIIFTWIIPILSSTNLPIEILKGKVNFTSVLVYIIILIIFTIVARIQWKCGLKKYTSAS